MKSAFPEKVHYSIYIFAIILLVIGIPTSKFLMSLSQLILFGNWILGGDLRNKLYLFWKNKTAVLISSIILLHFIGIFYSSDLEYALKDIRIKIPLFILPLIFSSSKPLTPKTFNNILLVFVAAVIFGTVVGMLILQGIYYNPHVETRGISIFISHIRFSLLICVSIFISGYFFMKSQKFILKTGCLLVILWLVYFLTLLGSLTGLIVLPLAFFVLFIATSLTSKSVFVKYGGMLVLLICSGLSVVAFKNIINKEKGHESIDFSKLEKNTALGNLYAHDTTVTIYENGNLIWVYYCKKELEDSWNKRSEIKLGSKDKSGNDIYNTLVRYLTSRGMRKDAAAVNQLSNSEVAAIEQGVVNINYLDISAIERRLHETVWEIQLYNNTGQADGHSLTQRIEYWKAAVNIVKNNWGIGVGTGDVPRAFEQEYINSQSSLSEKRRLRSHNQYLSLAVAFGLPGLIWFLFSLFYPLIKIGGSSNYLYFTFFLVAFISFFTEDTLETQAGVNFFAFLNSYLLFTKEGKSREV